MVLMNTLTELERLQAVADAAWAAVSADPQKGGWVELVQRRVCRRCGLTQMKREQN